MHAGDAAAARAGDDADLEQRARTWSCQPVWAVGFLRGHPPATGLRRRHFGLAAAGGAGCARRGRARPARGRTRACCSACATSAFDAGFDLAPLHAQPVDLALHVLEPRLRLLQQQVGAAFGFADDQARLRCWRVP